MFYIGKKSGISIMTPLF